MTESPKNKNVNNSKSISSRINIAEALKLRLVKHLSYQEIADKYGVAKSAVYQALKRFLSILVEPDELEAYKNHKVDLLSSAEMKLLERLVNDEVIEKASLNNVAYAFQQIFNSGRLEQGKSTERIDVFAVTAKLEDLEKKREELLQKIQIRVLKHKEMKSDENKQENS
ncbi:MAG: helix-turn-helix domain-containing protein [Planctomycetes bacterium]|nr:helix-turn-helix domain-containing protein [Planctomycetota bacterium]